MEAMEVDEEEWAGVLMLAAEMEGKIEAAEEEAA